MNEECRTGMLHDDMTLSKLMVYDESIEGSKHCRISRNLNRSVSSDQSQASFKKKVSSQEEPRGVKVKLEKGSGSQVDKPTCDTCGKSHYGNAYWVPRVVFGCGKDGHKVRDCPTRDGKQVAPNVPKDDVPKAKPRFYALQARGAKTDEGNDDDGKF